MLWANSNAHLVKSSGITWLSFLGSFVKKGEVLTHDILTKVNDVLANIFVLFITIAIFNEERQGTSYTLSLAILHVEIILQWNIQGELFPVL